MRHKNSVVHKYCFIIAVYIIAASFLIERLWFDMSSVKTHMATYILTKILVFLFSYVLSYLIKKTPKESVFYQVLILYLAISFITLLLTWPGIWRWDEFHILEGSRYFLLNSYQHFITSIFYMMCLMILPFPTGIIIIQNILIAVIVATIIAEVDKYILNWGKKSLVLIIPFLFFPVLDSNLYPIRSSVYAYLELGLLLFLIIELIKSKENKNYKISVKGMMIFSLLSIIVAVWRSESFYYMLVTPILFWLLFFKRNKKSVLFLVSTGILIGSIAGIKYQNKLLNDTIGDQNTIISTLPFIEDVLYNEDIKKEEIELLEDIDIVLNLEVLYNQGSESIWDSDTGLIRENYSKNQFKEYMLSYAKLVFKHPLAFLRVQLPISLQANGMLEGKQFIGSTRELYSGEGIYSVESIGEIFFIHDFTRPISANIRQKTITVLETLGNDPISQLLHKVMYNAFIGITITAWVWGWAVKNRKWIFSIILLLPLVKVILLIGTVPGSAFMYWYPNYLIGWFLGVLVLCISLKSRNCKDVSLLGMF